MENIRNIGIKLILGGALLGAFLVLANASLIPIVEAYDQENTHPALTDEIVDFYNLSFSNNKLSEQEKQWLVKGSFDEDMPPRWMNHFYDPVYNRGIAGFSTSKQWAMSSAAQSNFALFSESFAHTAGFLKSNRDFSYGRAVQDYAQGDKKRALLAFGHTLHLLEDAGVPEHTRNDAHPPLNESPYEKEMAKWNPRNLNIAKGLFLRREKPVTFFSVGSYFDRIANYSNSNFFSRDTISNRIYSKPAVNNIKKLRLGGKQNYFIVGNDPKNNQEFPIAILETRLDKGNLTILRKSLTNNEIGSSILDGYWDRLSKEVVLSGAGALRLFLEEAEKARQDHLVNGPKNKKSWLAQLLEMFGIGGNDDEELATREPELTTPDVVPTSGVQDTDGDNGDTDGVTRVSPSVSPVLSPKPVVSPLMSPIPTSVPQQLPISGGQRILDVKTTGRVVINEIAWAGTEASVNDEWLELYNTENYDVNLSGWVFKAEDGTPNIILEEGKTIKAQGYFLLERTGDTTVNTVPADQIYTGALSNDGESLSLTNAAGTVVDTVAKTSQGWPAGSSAGKISMERISGGGWGNFTGNPFAKDANGNYINGSPGAQNNLAATITSGGGGSGGGSGGNQTPSPTLSVSPTPTPTPSPTPLVTPTPTPTPTPSPSPEPDSSLLKVAINEIGWMGTATSSNDEWIELYNTTSQTVDLTGWTLKSLTGAPPNPQITLSGSIGPFGFYLLERTYDTSISDILADKIYAGALSDTGETLELRDASGALQDKISGDPGGWYAGDKDTDSSMERINPRTSGDNSANWNTNGGVIRNGLDAAGNPVNGTPKSRNSGYVAAKPSAVADLDATLNSPLTVTWSAPEDTDTLPASLSYDLRYSLDNFSDDDSVWDEAMQVASSSLPAVGEKGTLQSASFNIDHEYGQAYYFALKTKVIHRPTCDVGGVDKCEESEISNIAGITYPAAINPDSWAMLGKDRYHTSFAANAAGPGSAATVSWEFDAGAGNAVSQPVADTDGNIYFGASDGTVTNSKIYSVRKEGENIVENWPSYGINVSIGTPAILSDGTVYFGRIGAGGVLAFTALNPDGTKKWDYLGVSSIRSVTVSSAGEPHFTYSSGGDRIAVLNIDGSAKTPFPIISTGVNGFAPVVLDDGTIITAAKISGNQQFTAYSADGIQLWQVSTSQSYGKPLVDPSYDQTTGTTYSAAGPKLFSIPSGGSTLNPSTVAPWDYDAATIAAISSDTLYIGFNSPTPASGSLLYAVNKTDLSVKWSFQAENHVNNQLAIDKDQNTYFSIQNGKLYSIDSAGNQRWVIDSGSNSAISPILAENGLIWGYGSKVVFIHN